MAGLIVAGGASPLDILGTPDDPALTPFAGKYRFFDLALATLANSGVTTVHVAARRPSTALRAHVLASARVRRELRRPTLLPTPAGGATRDGRVGRLARSLAAYERAVRSGQPRVIVTLLADHVLQVDVRELVHAHHARQADVTLLMVPRPLGELGSAIVLHPGPDGEVAAVGTSSSAGPHAGLALAWTGDLVVNADVLPTVTTVLGPEAAHSDERALEALRQRVRVLAYDVFDGRFPRSAPYWHEPTTLESYYDAQMGLCTTRPVLDLFDPAWPLFPVPSGFGPAKVVADGSGRPGQVLNTLVSDGALVRGGATFNTVIGYDVVVDSGAEVEDTILLDGCRIGRGARVRRAIIGAGAVVGDGEQVGYDTAPPASARLLPSGLTVIPPIPPSPPVAAVAH